MIHEFRIGLDFLEIGTAVVREISDANVKFEVTYAEPRPVAVFNIPRQHFAHMQIHVDQSLDYWVTRDQFGKENVHFQVQNYQPSPFSKEEVAKMMNDIYREIEKSNRRRNV